MDADLKQALRKSKWNMDGYRTAVATYRNAENKEQKREMEKLISSIKSDFRSEIAGNDPKLRRLQKLEYEYSLLVAPNMFQESAEVYGNKANQKKAKERETNMFAEIIKLKAEIDEIKANKIYENAFEWRFEFPEVLNDDGDFVGFDVVIGNPPYVDLKELDGTLVKYIFSAYQTSSNRVNLYSTFVERAYSILTLKGYCSFIIPNSILMGSSYQELRNLIILEVYGIVKLPDKVFEDAAVETIVMEIKRGASFKHCKTIAYHKDDKIIAVNTELRYDVDKSSWDIYDEPKFNIYLSDVILKPLIKVHNQGNRLGKLAVFALGITPYDKHKGHSKSLIENREFHSDKQLTNEYKPLIKGENITPYFIEPSPSSFIKYGPWLGAPREERFFTEPRVIVRQIISGKPPRIYAGFTDQPLYFTQVGFAIIPENELTIFELTALLNSKLINYYHKYLFLDIEKELFQKILIENCKLFPVKPFQNKKVIRDIVEEITRLKANNTLIDTAGLESEIDRMVYQLYELTDEEIKIVEAG